ncbi:DNA-binding transcriptional repressor ArsR [bacterium BMS3Abin15]|nr:DNA-binding transcriptional repressor ArsR [bacterium BMS3Abin15]
MKDLEKILKALANRRRLAILKYLKHKGTATVTDIAREIKLSFRSTSKHLGILSAFDIIEKNQEGPQVFYELSGKQAVAAKSIIALL